VVVEAQQRAIDKDPDQPLRNLSIDAGAPHYRRHDIKQEADRRSLMAVRDATTP
jgi:hypothetical protein